MQYSNPLERVDNDIRDTCNALVVSEGLDLRDFDPLAFRALVAETGQQHTFQPDGLAQVVDTRIPGSARPIPVRVYTPTGAGPYPIMMYFHGGGWVAGDLDIQDAACRLLCAHSAFVVISVDYRLAPEHPFPAALEDCYGAVEWVAGHAEFVGGDPARLVVIGDSAGGNLAAAVCLMARDRNGPRIAHQTLVYAALQWEEWFVRGYVSREMDSRHPYVSPLLAEDLRNLAPAAIIAGEKDPLTAQGIAYALRLAEANVETHYVNYPGMPHGFFSDPASECCLPAIRKVSALVREATGLPSPVFR